MDGPLPSPEDTRRLCERRRGVGADGLLALAEDGETLGLANADGSPAGFSGNGVRCAALHAHERRGRPAELRLRLGTLEVACEVSPPGDPGEAWVLARVPPARRPPEHAHAALARALAEALGPGREAWEVDLGNPHLVLVAEAEEELPAPELEALRRQAPGYPDGVNVSWLVPGGPGAARLTTHERGVGPTPSCASAALAAYLVSRRRGEAADQLRLQVPGGELTLGGPPGEAWVAGPVRRVHEARWCG